MQEAGQAIYLVAWREDELAGRCTVLTTSKDDEVRQLLGAFPEMNALEARPPGQGTGTKIIACAEHTARERGAAMIGLAVAVSNSWLPQIPPGEYVQERHQRDKTEDPPHQFSAPPQVRPVGGQVDPHEDHSHGIEKTNQDLKQLLHNLNLPRSAGAVPAPVIHVVPCRPPPEPAGADAACACRRTHVGYARWNIL